MGVFILREKSDMADLWEKSGMGGFKGENWNVNY